MRKTKLLILAIMCAAIGAACALTACTTTHVHTIELVNEVEATCTEQGVASHYKCTGCGKLFADAGGITEITDADIEKTAALGHTGGTATCIAQAVCARCGESYGELGDHDFSGGFVHNEEGHYYGCKYCGQKQDGAEVIPHEYDTMIIEDEYLKSAATCQSKPIYHVVCICGAFEENGATFEYGEIGDHDIGWMSDADKHWKGCRTAGCDLPHTEEGNHTFPTTFTVTETSHYKECSTCGKHAEEGNHSYTEQTENSKFLISAATCQQKGVYHKSCICGDFEEDGDTFETANFGAHDWHYTVTDTQHSATCKNCSETIAATNHDFNATVKLKDDTKVYNEDDIITIDDLEVVGKCECGKEATASGSISSTFSYTVKGVANEKMTVSVDGEEMEVAIKSRKLPIWNITLVGATVDGKSTFQAKATKTISGLTPTAGKTFAGFYYDDDFNVYSASALPADYNDVNLTTYELSTYKLPDNEAGTTRSLKLTAMFLEDMPHFAPADYQDTDNIAQKVASHVVSGDKIATRFEWETTQKDKTYKVRSGKDTGTHNVNVTAPGVVTAENSKNIMLLSIVNNGSEAVTVKYQTENWYIVRGEMTVTVAANSTATVPFAYTNYIDKDSSFSACDHWLTVTSDMSAKAVLDVYGYIVVDGVLKANSFEYTGDREFEVGKVISSDSKFDGIIKVGADNRPINVYGVKTNLPANAKIEDGYHHIKIDAFGLDDEFTIFKKDEHSGWAQFMLSSAINNPDDGMTGETVTVNGIKMAKYTFTKEVAGGTTFTVNTNNTAPSSDINVRVPINANENRIVEFHIINYSNDELKLNINNEKDNVAAYDITLAGGKAGQEQIFTMEWNGAATPGGWLRIATRDTIQSGASFAVYGYWKATDTDKTKNMSVINNPTKTSFMVGEKFSSEGMMVRFFTGHSSAGNEPNIVNCVTDYDDYTFTAADVGTHEVTVYWAGMTTTYTITVTA